MVLILRTLRLNDQPVSQPIEARFDDNGGSIGRAEHNTLALPDPDRVISRVQAEVRCQDGQFAITNVSQANPILVAGHPLNHGESAPLHHQDLIRIGACLLEVDLPPAAEPAMDRTVIRPFSPTDPFADLLTSAPPPTPIRQVAQPSALFDPFEIAPPPAKAPAPPISSLPKDVFADLSAHARPGSIDDLFGLESHGTDPMAGFLAGTPAPPKPISPLSPIPVPLPPPKPVEPPKRRMDPPPVAVSVSVVAPPGSQEPLWAAFCAGAGLAPSAAPGCTPETMQRVGSLLRSAVEGTQQLMAIRAASKYELHAQVTMIRSRNNNPLKFVPDGTAALEQLLQPPLRGFLGGEEAMNDAMNDLVGHAIGTMAGMRAALDGVLDRFAPTALEQKLGQGSVFDNLLPMSRKARLWELYLQHFQSIRSEAQDDFQALFGKAFLAAYEQQLERLRAEKTPKPTDHGGHDV
ncbi:type VI secretion system-associated FHA domain protein TagH [Leptothrix ochracea]|uniref:type VI secretion system-associated FHA domain protein TagH n=1 Tax=Leptothrix ochracea TaxID=735331 RepID=UPI0034E2C4D5